jgi:peptide chain release factor 2
MNNQAQQLQQDINQAIEALSVFELQKKQAKLEEQMANPDFWNDQENAKTVSKHHSKLLKKITPWLDLKERIKNVNDMLGLEDKALEKELKTELDSLQNEFDKLSFALKLSGEFDEHDAYLNIHAGTGGTDAMDWAQMLERMYLRYFEKQDWKAEIVDRSTGEEAGIKSVTIRVEGEYVYGKLKGEHGVHRLVRLSPFNADSLRQTSFALVEVVPEIDEPGEVEVDESELKIDVYRAGGRGGQSVNTTDSAVRITHEPTGVVVAIQNERSQLQNKQTAMKILQSKLAQLKLEQHQDKISDLKGPDVQAAWGNQIRNYVLHPYTLVKDTRTKHETNDTQSVLDGGLDEFVEAYLQDSIGSN